MSKMMSAGCIRYFFRLCWEARVSFWAPWAEVPQDWEVNRQGHWFTWNLERLNWKFGWMRLKGSCLKLEHQSLFQYILTTCSEWYLQRFMFTLLQVPENRKNTMFLKKRRVFSDNNPSFSYRFLRINTGFLREKYGFHKNCMKRRCFHSKSRRMFPSRTYKKVVFSFPRVLYIFWEQKSPLS